MSPNDADGMANSVDPDQTAPLGAVWSGSALFAQAYLFENLGSLRYYYPSSQRFYQQYSVYTTLINYILSYDVASERVINHALKTIIH